MAMNFSPGSTLHRAGQKNTISPWSSSAINVWARMALRAVDLASTIGNLKFLETALPVTRMASAHVSGADASCCHHLLE